MKMNSLVKEIKEWARITDFHQPFIITHKLYLKKQFGKKIKKQILILETGSKAALGQRLEKEFLSLLKQAGRLDEMCRTGCQTEEELNTFEFLQKRIREKTVEVAELVQAAQRSEIKNQRSKRKITESAKADPASSKTTPRPGEWMTLTDVSKLLIVSKSTIHRWTQKGLIADNGKRGKKRKLSKTSVLIFKLKLEEEDLQKDVNELRKDSFKYG